MLSTGSPREGSDQSPSDGPVGALQQDEPATETRLDGAALDGAALHESTEGLRADADEAASADAAPAVPDPPTTPRSASAHDQNGSPTGTTPPATSSTALGSGTPRRRGRWVWLGVVLLWLAGLVAGFVAGLTVAARVSCSGSTGGFGCGTGGSIVGVLLVLIVICTVGTITILALDSRQHLTRWARHVLVGLVILALVVVAARVVVGTL